MIRLHRSPASSCFSSGGELQRVAITLCLGKPANVFLLDEPSAGLDCEQRVIAAKVIRFLRLSHVSFVFSSLRVSVEGVAYCCMVRTRGEVFSWKGENSCDFTHKYTHKYTGVGS